MPVLRLGSRCPCSVLAHAWLPGRLTLAYSCADIPRLALGVALSPIACLQQQAQIWAWWASNGCQIRCRCPRPPGVAFCGVRGSRPSRRAFPSRMQRGGNDLPGATAAELREVATVAALARGAHGHGGTHGVQPSRRTRCTRATVGRKLLRATQATWTPTPPHHRAQAIFWLGFFVPIHMVLLRAIATDAQHSTPALRGSRVWRAFQIVSVIHVAMYWVRACVIAH